MTRMDQRRASLSFPPTERDDGSEPGGPANRGMRVAYSSAMDDMEGRDRRLRRARVLIRLELALALAAPLVALFLYVAAPGFTGGGMYEPPLIETLVPWAGVGMLVVGVVWIVRLSRPDPEAGERTWRYRDYE